MYYQVHFGANYATGEYGWTTDLETVKRQIEENGVLWFLLDMQKSGAVKHIGFSTHTPSLAHRVLDAGLVDQLMFSINPGYDYQYGEYAKGSVNESWGQAMFR